MKERVSWIEASGIPLHYWNYTFFKRIVEVWGDLISLGENSRMAKSFNNMLMLVSTKQPERIDELIYIEVRKAKFQIKVIEIRLSELFDESSRGLWREG